MTHTREGERKTLYFCSEIFKYIRVMVEKKQTTPIYRRVKDICVDLYTQNEAVEKRLLAGKALLNTDKGEFLFSQNPPRGPRSVEIGRTAHSRFVRRPDGLYTVTFRVDTRERNYKEQLLAEVRELTKSLDLDAVAQKAIAKAKEKEGGK